MLLYYYIFKILMQNFLQKYICILNIKIVFDPCYFYQWVKKH